jgi:iron complex outermembrane receptor protein
LSAAGVLTDSAGNYSLPVSSLNQEITFSHISYVPVVMKVSFEHAPAVMMKRSGIFLSETIVQSFERNSSIRNIPAAVTVLNRTSLERFGSESFVPAMNTVPGVKMDERSPGSYRLSIRGNLLRSTFGVRNVKVYWNGIPFTDANGTTYINELSLNDIGKIEILKGPSGSMYGSGTGGVVLLSSNIPAASGNSFQFKSTAGSYGAFTANATYNQATGNSATNLSVTRQQSDGYRKHTNMRRQTVNFNGNYEISNRQKINAIILYSDLFYQTPGGLTLAEMNADPTQARPAAGIFKSAEAQKAALYLKTIYAGFANAFRFGNNWNNTTAIYFSNTNFRNPAIRNYERKTEQGIGLRSVTKYSKQFFTATFGTEYQYGFTNTSTFGNKLGEIDTLQIHDEISSGQFNVFLQGDFNITANLLLNAGISYNNFRFGFMRLNQLPAVKERSNFKPQFVPRISLLKKFSNAISVFIAVSKGYSPPSIDEVHASDGNFNKQLNAETAASFETGIKGDIIKNKLSVDASFYWLRLGNTIVSRRDSGGADYFANAGKTKQQGFEIAVQYLPVNNYNRFTRQLKLWANYTNLHASFINYQQGTAVYDGNKLTGTAPQVFVLGADMITSSGVYANATFSYTGKIPLNDANVFFATDYKLFFIKTGYKVNLGKKILADIFLAFDKSFNAPYSLGNDLNAAGNRFFNPAAPQNLNGGFTIKFIL